MLEDKIRICVIAAVQQKDNIAKNILRLALSEIQRENKTLTEIDKENIVRKLIKSNKTTLGLTTNEANKKELENEIAVLSLLLPKAMTKEEVISFVKDNNITLNNDNVGKSIGAIMKVAKEKNIVIESNTVREAITELTS
jgi:uncharacterized protein YqeY